MNPWLTLVAGLIAGAAVAWLLAKARAERTIAVARIEAEGRTRGAESSLNELRAQLQELPRLRDQLKKEEIARVAAETRHAQAQAELENERRLLDEARAKLEETFKALAAEALKSNDQQFMTLAKSAFETMHTAARGDLEARQKEIGALVSPLKDALERYEKQIFEMERARQAAYGGLKEQLNQLSSVNQQLQKETGVLANALKGGPQVRGRWGEMTLRRAAELAGMAEHCDFIEQETLSTDAGRYRPDMIVNLPGGRRIAVDAKAPMQAFLDAATATSEEVRAKDLARHSQLVREHMNQLASKSYWAQFGQDAPEIVVLFLPGESFFSAALEQDRALIEDGMERHVVLSTPTTFVSLLKAVAYGWRQQSAEQNAREISDRARELYERLGTFLGHFASAGAALARAVEAYNKATGSLESRVLTSARRFKELGVTASGDLEEVSPVEATPRELAAPEHTEGGSAAKA